jgi:hypothetical protein
LYLTQGTKIVQQRRDACVFGSTRTGTALSDEPSSLLMLLTIKLSTLTSTLKLFLLLMVFTELTFAVKEGWRAGRAGESVTTSIGVGFLPEQNGHFGHDVQQSFLRVQQ